MRTSWRFLRRWSPWLAQPLGSPRLSSAGFWRRGTRSSFYNPVTADRSSSTERSFQRAAISQTGNIPKARYSGGLPSNPSEERPRTPCSNYIASRQSSECHVDSAWGRFCGQRTSSHEGKSGDLPPKTLTFANQTGFSRRRTTSSWGKTTDSRLKLPSSDEKIGETVLRTTSSGKKTKFLPGRTSSFAKKTGFSGRRTSAFDHESKDGCGV